MSAEALMRLRASGHAPAALWVVVGDCPARLTAMPDCIHVTGRPDRMDWRGVLNLHVDVFDTGTNNDLLGQTLDAIEVAQPKAIGVACAHEVVGLSPEHEAALHRIRRHLCN